MLAQSCCKRARPCQRSRGSCDGDHCHANLEGRRSQLALGFTEEQYEERASAYGDKCLEKVLQLAAAAGVACTPIQTVHARPYEAIIDAADKHACDLIVMGSHGRRGVTRLLLGSETSKIAAQSKTSVLVHRG